MIKVIAPVTRRTLLTASALLPLAACGVVTATTSNGATTVTLDVAKANAWATAFENAAALVAGLPGIAGTPAGVAILGVESLVKLDFDAFTKAANGNVTLTFDRTSVPAAVQSLLADGRTLLADARAALPAVAQAAVDQANRYVLALSTMVSLFEAAAGVSAVGAAPLAMSEGEALSVLKVW